jgi:hypothetical protein
VTGGPAIHDPRFVDHVQRARSHLVHAGMELSMAGFSPRTNVLLVLDYIDAGLARFVTLTPTEGGVQ